MERYLAGLFRNFLRHALKLLHNYIFLYIATNPVMHALKSYKIDLSDIDDP